jgi:phospholipid transport system substrate-binding protein
MRAERPLRNLIWGSTSVQKPIISSRRTFLLAALASPLAGFFPSRTARAEVDQQTVDGAVKFMEWLANQAITILQQTDGGLEVREQKFRALLKDGFAMEFVARFVLGKHWRRTSAEERTAYLTVFTEYVLKTYSRRMGGYSGETFQTVGARAAGKQDIIVQTRIIQPSGPPILADWRIRVFDGNYKIIDVMVEGVSMAVTQRSEFNAVISQHGMQGLLEALRARTEKYSVTAG